MKFLVVLSSLVALSQANPIPEATPNSALVSRATFKSFAGTNAYWAPFLTNDADVDKTFAAIKAAGLTVLRTWAFNDVTSCNGVHFQCWSGSAPVINTGANGLQRLDAVVKAAEKYGIKLVLPFVNNWGDYGGMDVYVKKLGGGADHKSFYTNTAIQAAYKNYVKTIVNRYKGSPAIFSWQLANEPRCKGCDVSIITKWATTMSAYVKSLDPAHYVSLGDEGFFNDGPSGTYPYQGSEGIDFKANLKISTLDYGTLHMYPINWGVDYEWGNKWITDHATACAQAGKACVIEEYGVEVGGETRTSVINKWHKTMKSSGLTADMFWQFGLTLSGGKTSDDKYTIYTDDPNYKTLVTDWAASR